MPLIKKPTFFYKRHNLLCHQCCAIVKAASGLSRGNWIFCVPPQSLTFYTSSTACRPCMSLLSHVTERTEWTTQPLSQPRTPPVLRSHSSGNPWTRNFAGCERLGTGTDEWMTQIFYLEISAKPQDAQFNTNTKRTPLPSLDRAFVCTHKHGGYSTTCTLFINASG